MIWKYAAAAIVITVMTFLAIVITVTIIEAIITADLKLLVGFGLVIITEIVIYKSLA